MPRCQPASPASPKGKYVKKSIDGKRQLKLKLRSKPGAHGERFQGVEKTTSGNFQAFVSKKGKKVGVGTYSTEEEAATQRALDYANNLENLDFGRERRGQGGHGLRQRRWPTHHRLSRALSRSKGGSPRVTQGPCAGPLTASSVASRS